MKLNYYYKSKIGIIKILRIEKKWFNKYIEIKDTNNKIFFVLDSFLKDIEELPKEKYPELYL